MIRNSTIIRDKLLRLFEDLSDERYIYICAPAGYGKTVAVRQWLDRIARAKAAIALDEYDNNLSHFCERFCAALRACQPQNTALSEIASRPSFGGVPDEFTLRAINALSDGIPNILVIDDLHFIYDERVLRHLLIFLKHLPNNFQVVLVSRDSLPPGFSDLRSKGGLADITAEHLRFSGEEISMLCKKRGVPVTTGQVKSMRQATEGWAIGINALLLSGGADAGKTLDSLEGFIRANVWERWDEPTREFMLNTAAARELEPSLCAALTGISDCEKLLYDLTQSDVFIFQASNGIYHYHSLFHNFLKTMLAERGDEYLFPLLEKEGEWHLSRQDFYSAVECFIRCKNYDGIAKCFDLLEVTDRNDFVIDKMLSIIQNPEINTAAEKYPFLFYMMAWAAFADGRADDASAYMDQYYARYHEIAERDPTHAHNIFYLRIIDFRTSLRDLMSAISALPAIHNTKGVQGTSTMNMPLLHRSIRDFSELAGEDTEANIAMMKAAVGWLFGEETELLLESLAASLLYEQGHLEKAFAHALAANAECKSHFASESKFCAMAILTVLLDALGQPGEAERATERISSMIEQDRAYYLTRNFNALLVRRKLANGDIKTANDWISAHETALYDSPTMHRSFETFTICRAYITSGDYDGAIILLKKVLELAAAYKRTLAAIEAQILLSIAHWKKTRGFQDDAIQYLEDAVSLAYCFGYTQMFVNEGTELSPMMRRLMEHMEQRNDDAPIPVSFIKTLHFKMLEHQGGELISGQPVVQAKYTDKQKNVMKLLCEGKSYKETTEILGIKLSTLRSHIALIYKKLDVTNEMDAITKIKLLGLLD